MQKILLAIVVIALSPASVEAADPSSVAKRDQRMTLSKPRAINTAITRNPCASYGVGFVQIDGTSTCVKMGGSVSVGAGVSGR